MASLFTHAVAAASLGTCLVRADDRRRVWAAGALCAVAPDADVLAFRLGIPYEDMLGHRGLTHSFLFAACLGLGAALLLGRGPRGARTGDRARVCLFLVLAAASHGLLDAMTSGGLGVAFFAPFDDGRWFLPFRPIRVSPISVRLFLTGRGLRVLASELVWVWLPCAALVLAGVVWRRVRVRTDASAQTAAAPVTPAP